MFKSILGKYELIKGRIRYFRVMLEYPHIMFKHVRGMYATMFVNTTRVKAFFATFNRCGCCLIGPSYCSRSNSFHRSRRRGEAMEEQ
jgi:hypothetical protein